MRILVTGGAGYIGSVLVPKLISKGYQVTVLDNFTFGQNSLLELCQYKNFEIIKGDVRDIKVIDDTLKKADVVIPLAALVGAPMCNKEPRLALEVNQEAIRTLCRKLSSSQKIILPVTNSGYGIGQKGIFCTEDTPLNPISLYGKTKVKAEEFVLEREQSISFRLATVFGVSPRMRTDLLVNDFVYRAIKDGTVVIFEGHFKRNYIHIQDVARVFIHAIENFDSMKGRAFNVGLDDANLSKLELAEAIKKKIKNFVFLEAPIGEDPDKRDYIVSNQRLAETGFKTEWTIDLGIEELVKGYKIIQGSNLSNV